MGVLAITLSAVITVVGAPTGGAEVAEPWTILTCARSKSAGKAVGTGALSYLVPKGAILKKFKDVDYGGYRVLRNQDGKLEVLRLVWEVNGSPFPSQGTINDSVRYEHRILKLPNGTDGIDARGASVSEGGERKWRNAGVMSEFAFYRDVSVESAKYFDAIIDSVCFQPR